MLYEYAGVQCSDEGWAATLAAGCTGGGGVPDMPPASLTEYPPLICTHCLYTSVTGVTLTTLANRYSSTAASIRLPGVGMAMDSGGHTQLYRYLLGDVVMSTECTSPSPPL